MYKAFSFILLSALLLQLCSCEKSTTPPVEEKTLSRQEAEIILFENYFMRADPIAMVFALENPLLPGDSIMAETQESFYPIAYDTPQWVFFADHFYLYATYPRPFGSLIFIDQINGNISTALSYLPADPAQYDTIYYEWKRQDLELPVLAFSDSIPARGCSDFFIYIENADQNAFIWIEADTAQLGITDTLQTFDLQNPPDGLKIGLDFYYFLPPNAVSMSPKYCNDVRTYSDPPRLFQAVAGQVSIKRVPVAEGAGLYGIYLRFSAVTFRDDAGRTVDLDLYEADGILVGWYPG